MSDTYFKDFEHRHPPKATVYPKWAERLWQIFGSAAVFLGLYYISWRWTNSLNHQAIVFAVAVALAETGMFIGLILTVFNIWRPQDTREQIPPSTRQHAHLQGEGSVKVDIFVTTYDEAPELVRATIIDAKTVIAPPNVDVRVVVLDDGLRPAMRSVCAQESVDWLGRGTNSGYKAGNLRHGLEHSNADFIVICDADARLQRNFLQRTLGYFRERKVAWVQTPHWFYDIPSGTSLASYLTQWKLPQKLVAICPKNVSNLRFGADPFGSDPKVFFDVIQRRRNRHGGSFCFGAGSIWRVEPLYEVAIHDAQRQLGIHAPSVANRAPRTATAVVRPFAFHVSEYIYTSMQFHKSTNKWKSVYHPDPLSRMLSPLDVSAWATQRSKYANGSMDILRSNWSNMFAAITVPHRLVYGATFWSYLTSIFVLVIILAPIITMTTGIAPVDGYSFIFMAHLLPFLVITEIAVLFGYSLVPNFQARLQSIALFWINLSAIVRVLRRHEIGFPPTPKFRRSGDYRSITLPYLILLGCSFFALVVGALKFLIYPPPYGALPSRLTVCGYRLICWRFGCPYVLHLEPEQSKRTSNTFWSCNLYRKRNGKLKISRNLWQMRSNITIILGLVLAGAIVFAIDGPVSSRIVGLNFDWPQKSPLRPEIPSPQMLTEQEFQDARIAWNYFENNTQQLTGLVNSVDGFPATTIWDQGSYLMALVSARKLHVIEADDFDLRIRQFLAQLQDIELFYGILPNKSSNTQTVALTNYQNEPVEKGIGWSALDIARLMLGLKILTSNYPKFAALAQSITARFNLQELTQKGALMGAHNEEETVEFSKVQEGRLGYEEYAARGVALYGLDVQSAIRIDDYAEEVTVLGTKIATDARYRLHSGAHSFTVTEPYLLMAFELGLDETSVELLYRLFQAQRERYKTTGIVTALSEDHLDQPPYFLYHSIVGDGVAWASLDDDGNNYPELRSFSTKAGYGLSVLYSGQYAEILRQTARNAVSAKGGWIAGFYEADGRPNRALTLNTNAVILEALHFKRFGPLLDARF